MSINNRQTSGKIEFIKSTERKLNCRHHSSSCSRPITKWMRKSKIRSSKPAATTKKKHFETNEWIFTTKIAQNILNPNASCLIHFILNYSIAVRFCRSSQLLKFKTTLKNNICVVLLHLHCVLLIFFSFERNSTK